jgi:hypothetical protein
MLCFSFARNLHFLLSRGKQMTEIIPSPEKIPVYGILITSNLGWAWLDHLDFHKAMSPDQRCVLRSVKNCTRKKVSQEEDEEKDENPKLQIEREKQPKRRWAAFTDRDVLYKQGDYWASNNLAAYVLDTLDFNVLEYRGDMCGPCVLVRADLKFLNQEEEDALQDICQVILKDGEDENNLEILKKKYKNLVFV